MRSFMLRPYNLKTWACKIHGSDNTCMVNEEYNVWNRKHRHYRFKHFKNKQRNWKKYRNKQYRPHGGTGDTR